MAYNIGTFAPAIPLQFFTDSGLVASGYKLFTYIAGTTTKATTYTIADLSAANTNPIVLDAAGRCVIFLSPLVTQSYKYILATPTTADPPAGGDIIKTWDGLGIVPNSEANIDILGTTVGAIPAGTCVILNSVGTWVESDPANAQFSIDAPRIGFVVAAGTPAVIRLAGKLAIAGIATGFTYYLSTTQGEVTSTAPTGAFHIVPVGFGDAAADLVFPVNALFRVGARLALKSFGFSAGQSNAAGGADTQLTSFDVPIPGGVLDQPGACLLVEGTLAVAANADPKTFKLKVGSGTLVTVWGSSANVANHVVPFRFLIYYRTAITGSIVGIAYHGAAAAGAPANYLVNFELGAVDWSAGQTLTMWASANTVASVKLTDFTVYVIRSYQGTTV